MPTTPNQDERVRGHLQQIHSSVFRLLSPDPPGIQEGRTAVSEAVEAWFAYEAELAADLGLPPLPPPDASS